MNTKIRFGLILVVTVFLAACGGGGGGGGGSGSPGGGDDGGGDGSGGDGDGDALVVVTLPAVAAYSIVTDIQALDLNDDTLPDLLVARTGETPFYSGVYLQALVNDGERGFTDETDTYFPDIDESGQWYEHLYLADLDGDGKQDIIRHMDQIEGSALAPLMRQAGGEFLPSDDATLVAAVSPLLPLDVDLDGDVDLLARTATNNTTEWLLYRNRLVEDGTMTFEDLGVVSSGLADAELLPTHIYSPAILDIDGDDYPDIIYGGPKYADDGFVDEQIALVVLLNDGDNTFTESAAHVFGGAVPAFVHQREMVVADFNDDGDDDVVVTNHGYDVPAAPTERNALLLSDGAGGFDEQAGDASTFDYLGFTHSAAAGDIDGDGDADIVFNDMHGPDVEPGKQLRILLNDGNAAFTNIDFTLPDPMQAKQWIATLLVDLDGDGFPELVLGGGDSGNDSIILWNDGTGSYQ